LKKKKRKKLTLIDIIAISEKSLVGSTQFFLFDAEIFGEGQTLQAGREACPSGQGNGWHCQMVRFA